jgi:phytoene synthase
LAAKLPSSGRSGEDNMTIAQPISHLIGSSQFTSAPTDTMKDEDNASWLLKLPEGLLRDWTASLKWMRVSDRLAEAEALGVEDEEYRFSDFLEEFGQLRRHGFIYESSPLAETFQTLRERWEREGFGERELRPWDTYLKALRKYTPPPAIQDYDECETMYRELSGSLFLTFPLAPLKYADALNSFGALDQLYNNVRDLAEDTARGICFFPDALLRRFSLCREEIALQITHPDYRFASMMDDILTTFAGRLRRKAAQLIRAEDLHWSWKLLLRMTLERYVRTESVFRECRYNAAAFNGRYWGTCHA